MSYGHPTPVLLTSTLIPISLLLIFNPLLPLILPALPSPIKSIISNVPLPEQPTLPALQANIGFALLAFVGAVWIVPRVSGAFVEKGLRGRDLLKPGGRTSGPWMCVIIPHPFCSAMWLRERCDVGMLMRYT